MIKTVRLIQLPNLRLAWLSLSSLISLLILYALIAISFWKSNHGSLWTVDGDPL
jgi:hypothetical protein